MKETSRMKAEREKRLADREFKNLNLVINASPEVIREIHNLLIGHGITTRQFSITNRSGARMILNTRSGYEPWCWTEG